MAKKSKKPAKRARKKTAKAPKARKVPKARKALKARKAPKAAKAKVRDLASGGASDDVTGHLMGFVRTRSSFLEE